MFDFPCLSIEICGLIGCGSSELAQVGWLGDVALASTTQKSLADTIGSRNVQCSIEPPGGNYATKY